MTMTSPGATSAATPQPTTPALDDRHRLDGRIAIVTGGGSGLGEALMTVLAEAGTTVVGVDVRAEPIEAVAEAVRAAGGQALAEVCDVGDSAAATRLAERVVDRFGGVDILVNSAGIDVTAPFHEIEAERWNRVIDVNLVGPANMIRAVLPAMLGRGQGHIVNIASTAAKRAWTEASAYHASKWGLLGLSHALHAELRREGIGVTAVIAGGMRTPFILDRFPDLDVAILQEPRVVAEAIRDLLCVGEGSVVAEATILPFREQSWP
jgi:NAD(P)-dependent dehydrogenase (short-subunit alcohol dehydrogenase family)